MGKEDAIDLAETGYDVALTMTTKHPEAAADARNMRNLAFERFKASTIRSENLHIVMRHTVQYLT